MTWEMLSGLAVYKQLTKNSEPSNTDPFTMSVVTIGASEIKEFLKMGFIKGAQKNLFPVFDLCSVPSFK
jgi:hypothetical protein